MIAAIIIAAVPDVPRDVKVQMHRENELEQQLLFDDGNEDHEPDDRCRRRAPTPQVWSAPWRLGARKPGRCAERRRRLDVSIGACSGMIWHTFRPFP